MSWLPPSSARPAARGCSASPALAAAGRPGACGRARGGSRGPRGPGGAWPRLAGEMPRAPTATAWSCCGEQARPAWAGSRRAARRGRGSAAGLGAGRADAPAPSSRTAARAAGREGTEAAGTFTAVTELQQSSSVCHLA